MNFSGLRDTDSSMLHVDPNMHENLNSMAGAQPLTSSRFPKWNMGTPSLHQGIAVTNHFPLSSTDGLFSSCPENKHACISAEL